LTRTRRDAYSIALADHLGDGALGDVEETREIHGRDGGVVIDV
jgi:hypothetical protein